MIQRLVPPRSEPYSAVFIRLRVFNRGPED
jgi:hypothetical protein